MSNQPTTTFYIEASTRHIRITTMILTSRNSDGNGTWTTLDSLEQAEAIAAEFPKSYKLQAYHANGYGMPDNTFAISMRAIELGANGTNGGANETGIKRARNFVRKARALGHTVEFLDKSDVWANGLDAATTEELVG